MGLNKLFYKVFVAFLSEIEVKLIFVFVRKYPSIPTITTCEPGIMRIVKRKYQVSAIISLTDNPFYASRSARVYFFPKNNKKRHKT